MDYPNNNTESKKNKHLTKEERTFIEIRLRDGYSAYRISKELQRPKSTISYEIKRGTTIQIIQGKRYEIYLADTGQAVYEKHRLNSCRHYKRLECSKFIDWVIDKFKNESWSIDACVGYAIENALFKPSEMVSTKTLYNYIDMGLLPINNSDLPMKLRRNTKPERIRKNKKKLGTSIEERPEEIKTREEFGHWEADTVIGEKSGQDCVLLTLLERKTRESIVRKITAKTADAVMDEIKNIRAIFGDKFSEVFKTITTDNGSEFADLACLEESTNTKVYFTHPYSSYEKGTNERHNGLIRRFIPKGKRIDDYSADDIAFIEDWMNTLPRKILNYRSPEDLFNEQLDTIYAA
jgi:transposase, IS30 family